MRYFNVLILNLITIAGLSSAHAFSVDTVVQQNTAGAYVIETVVSCNESSEKYCQDLCQDSKICSRPEPVCLNCAGTANELIRVLFTRLEYFYAPVPATESADWITEKLKQGQYVLLAPQSVYNFHRPWDSQEVLASFKTFCATETERPLLLVELNIIGEPTELKAVICKNQNTSYAQLVKPRGAGVNNFSKVRLF